MAKMYGAESSFLVKNIKRFLISLAVLFVSVAVLFVGYVSIFPRLQSLPLASGLRVFYIGIIAIFCISKLGDYLFKRSQNFGKGQSGENVVIAELRKLPDAYSVFRNFKMPGMCGDVDMIVIGPTGVFAIEVKSSRFKNIKLAEGELRLGRFKGRILRTIRRKAKQLNCHILENIGIYQFVAPVVVFSHPESIPHFGMHEVDGVIVINLKWLVGLLSKEAREVANLHETEALFKSSYNRCHSSDGL